MIQKNKIPSILQNFNAIAKSKKLLQAGVFAVFATVPALSASIEIEDVNVNNIEEVKAFAKHEAKTFLQSYKVTPPELLKKYVTEQPKNEMIVNLIVTEEPIKYDGTSKSMSNIKEEMIKHNKGESYDNIAIVGGTLRSITIQITKRPEVDLSENYLTLWLSKLNVSNILKQNVYIASELQEHPCDAKQTKNHEDEHISFNKASFQAYSSITEEFYKAALKPVNSIKIPTNNENTDSAFQDYIEQTPIYINKITKDIIEAMLKTSDKLNAIIDTLDSYNELDRKTNKICGDNPKLSAKIRKEINY